MTRHFQGFLVSGERTLALRRADGTVINRMCAPNENEARERSKYIRHTLLGPLDG